MTLFMIPFVLVGIFAIAMTLREAYIYTQLHQQGVSTKGTMLERDYSTDDGTTYFITYAFQFRERTYQNRQSVSESLYDAFERGGTLDIIFTPNNPEHSKIAGTNSIWTPVALGGFSICWNAFIFFFIYISARSADRNDKLYKHGQLIDAELVHFKGSSDSDGDYQVTVTCRFVSPTSGEIIEKKRSYQRNALKEAPAPPIGSRLAVLYVNDKTWDVL